MNPGPDDCWRAFRSHPCEETFGPVYERTCRLVYTICYRILRDPEDAADAFQSAYCRLLAAAKDPKIVPDTTDFNRFVGRLAACEAGNLRDRRRRRQKREVAMQPTPEPADSNPPPDRIAATAETRDKVEALASLLPKKFRVPLLLHYFDGMTQVEIAGALELPEGTVRSRIARGLKKLRSLVRRAGLGEATLTIGSLISFAHLLEPPAALSAGAVFAQADALLASGGAIAAGAGIAGAGSSTGVFVKSFVGGILVNGKTVATAAIVVFAVLGLIVPRIMDSQKNNKPEKSAIPPIQRVSDVTTTSGEEQPQADRQLSPTTLEARTSSIAGTARIEDTGAPAAGAVVRTVSRWFVEVTAHTDEKGSFTLAGIPPGTICHLAAEDPPNALVVTDMPAFVLEPGEVREGVTLLLRPARGGAIAGRVVGRRVTYRKVDRLTAKTRPADFENIDEVPLQGVGIVLRRNDEVLERVLTNGKGGYEFARFPAGQYSVLAELPEAAAYALPTDPGRFRRVRLIDESQTDVDFCFRLDHIAISGCVSDSNGRPIRGAELTADFQLLRPSDVEGGSRTRSLGAVRTLSGADGRYRLDHLAPASFHDAARYLANGVLSKVYVVRAEAAGYADSLISVPPFTENLLGEAFQFTEDYLKAYEGDDPVNAVFPPVTVPEGRGNLIAGIDFVLTRNATVSGRVCDTRGKVVAGSVAQIRMVDAKSSEPAPRPLEPRPPTPPDWTRLDDAGRFRWDNVAPGTYGFEIARRLAPRQRARNAPLIVRAGDAVEGLEVVVESNEDRGGLAGRVRDALTGDPIEKFSAEIVRVESPDEPTPSPGRRGIGRAEEGLFRIDGISPGRATVEILAFGYERHHARINIVSGQTTEATFELGPRGRIAGIVVDDSSGSPIADFSAKITSIDAPVESPASLGRPTIGLTQGGTFAVEDISPGRATLEITADGYAREVDTISVVSGETTERSYRLRRGGALSGLVTLDGRNKGRAYVIAWRRGEHPSKKLTAQSNGEGYYELRGLSQGEYQVGVAAQVRGRGGSQVQINRFATATIESGTTKRLDFALDRDATILGAITCPKNVRVRIVVLDNQRNRTLGESERAAALSWGVEKSRHYEVNYLSPGTYTVIARCTRERDGGTPENELSQTVTLNQGQTAVADFKFR